MKKCGVCEYLLDDSWSFCPKCGSNKEKKDLFYEDKPKKSVNNDVYKIILDALESISINIGRSTLVDYIRGSRNQKIIQKKLNEKPYYNSLNYLSASELLEKVDELIKSGHLMIKKVFFGSYPRPIIKRTSKKYIIGEIESEELLIKEEKKTNSLNLSLFKYRKEPSSEDFNNFEIYSEFLEKYNTEQKLAIVDENKRILCVAGAGSGKTTVLTGKIDYLVNKKGVNPSKILAITFTRKAASELKERLSSIRGLNVATFNSFCEGLLKIYEHLIYDRPHSILSYKQKIKLLKDSISKLNINLREVSRRYFPVSYLTKYNEYELINMIYEDIFSIIDHLKNESQGAKDLLHKENGLKSDDKYVLRIFHDVIQEFTKKMSYIGLRDFNDQVLHVCKALEENTSFRTMLSNMYDYILIDEYQDINKIQNTLINLILRPESNLFVVGDPRQSIFSFRGSNVDYILNFHNAYPDSSIIVLKDNYRSPKNIVHLANESIKELNIVPQTGIKDQTEDIYLIECGSEDEESLFISKHVKRLIETGVSPKEIFVIARTNSQLNLLEEYVKDEGISYIKKSIEEKNMNMLAGSNEVTLSTIHAIKGLEADVVFFMGVVSSVLPSRSKDNELIRVIKNNFTSNNLEEKRLFYVGLTRAKKMLYLTHFLTKRGKRSLSPFLTENIISFFKEDKY